LVRLIAGYVCLHASMSGTRMAAPLMALKQGYSAWAVGLLLALFSLAQVFLALPAGRFVDAHGLKRPAGCAIAVAFAGALVAMVGASYAVLCLSALCLGAATGTVSIALQRHVGRAARDAVELKQFFGWLSIGPAVSNFLGPVLAGLLIDYAGAYLGGTLGDGVGFRAAYGMMALLAMGAWLCMRTAQERTPVVRDTTEQAASVWHLLRSARMRQLLLVNWLLAACFDVHTFVVPVLGHERAFSASVIGTILGGFAMASACVRIALPLLARHLREWMVVSVAMLLTALLFAVYPAMQSAWAMGLCSVLLGLVLGSVQPMMLSMLHQITPHAQQGQALGLRLMVLNLSSVLMPIFFGAAGALVGLPVVFWTTGAAVGLGVRTAWRLRSLT
jgi:MFS family permease